MFTDAKAVKPRVSRPIGHLMALSGLCYLAQGWIIGSSGFSSANQIPTLLGIGLILVWTVWLLVAALRMKTQPFPRPHQTQRPSCRRTSASRSIPIQEASGWSCDQSPTAIVLWQGSVWSRSLDDRVRARWRGRIRCRSEVPGRRGGGPRSRDGAGELGRRPLPSTATRRCTVLSGCASQVRGRRRVPG